LRACAGVVWKCVARCPSSSERPDLVLDDPEAFDFEGGGQTTMKACGQRKSDGWNLSEDPRS
jgi:hypothetical protein